MSDLTLRIDEIAEELALDLKTSTPVRSIAKHYAELEDRYERLEAAVRPLVAHLEPAPSLEEQWLEAEVADLLEPEVGHGRMLTQVRVRVQRGHGEAFWDALAYLWDTWKASHV